MWSTGKHIDYGKDALDTTFPVSWLTETERIDFNKYSIGFCAPTFYSSYNFLSLTYQCTACDSACYECNGSTAFDCISCHPGYTIIEED